jgi:hypothetical protein
LAEQQRRGAFVGLAIASALVVLVASGVAVNRLGSDPIDRTASGAADQAAQGSGSGPTPGATAAGEGAGAAASGASGALSSASAPVPPPVPASGNARQRTGRSKATGTRSPTSMGDRAANTPEDSTAASSQPAGGSTDGSGGGSAGTGGPEAPDPQGAPDPTSLAAASASVGEGQGGAVAGVGLGGAQPEVDLTVGTNPLVGDAPPSQGTGIGFGGSFFNPPPTVPILPG